MDDEMRKEVLGEVLMNELKAIREYVKEVPNIKKTVDQIDTNLEEVQTNVKAIFAVVKNHEQRITDLETA